MKKQLSPLGWVQPMVGTLESGLTLDDREYPAKPMASFMCWEGGSWTVLI